MSGLIFSIHEISAISVQLFVFRVFLISHFRDNLLVFFLSTVLFYFKTFWFCHLLVPP